MAIQTVNPTVTTTPDQGGTLAMTGMINTGHASTVASCSSSDTGSTPSDSSSEAKSGRWSSFSSFPSGTINTLALKLNWSVTGDLSAIATIDAGSDGEIELLIDHTIDGGSNWVNDITRNVDVFAADGSDSDALSDSGAISVSLATSQNISLVQVRVRINTNTFASAPSPPPPNAANVAVSITLVTSDIKLEADITPAPAASGGANKAIVLM